ncbi:hypothetical protein LXA31_17775, partial [Erwinia amylovora]|uniref:hypothetical protein n=1 Tax=Erwinia amylovora TaxID=552 RepID=UPI0020C1406A
PVRLPRHRRCGNRGNRRRAAGKIPCTVAISLLLKRPPCPPVRLPGIADAETEAIAAALLEKYPAQ